MKKTATAIGLAILAYALCLVLLYSQDPGGTAAWLRYTPWTDICTDLGLSTFFMAAALSLNYLMIRRLIIPNVFGPRAIACILLVFLLDAVLFVVMADLYTFLFETIIGRGYRSRSMLAYSISAAIVGFLYLSLYFAQSYSMAKNAMLRSQMDLLKAQVDPHFMFNNFSILSGLIEEDADAAHRFLSRLSLVYRYVLQNMEQDMVTIAEEIKFLDSYVYLMKCRYGDSVMISIDDNLRHTEGYIPPVSLQLLVENAIKHNARSDAA